MLKKHPALLLALLLMAIPCSAQAAKARNIQTSEDSAFHASHLIAHLNAQDCRCTGSYVKARTEPGGNTSVGHLEIEDKFSLLDVDGSWALIRVTDSHKNSPDSFDGMTGWVNADYIDCSCSNAQYRSPVVTPTPTSTPTPTPRRTPVPTPVPAARVPDNIGPYESIVEILYWAVAHQWDSETIASASFDPDTFVHSLTESGYILRDLDQNGESELLILPDGGSKRKSPFLAMAYTMKNGEPHLLFQSSADKHYYLLKDNTILLEESDNPLRSSYSLYTVDGDALKLAKGKQSINRYAQEKDDNLVGFISLAQHAQARQ